MPRLSKSLPNVLLGESGVARRALHVDVAQLFLHDAQVFRAPEKLRATRMTECMGMHSGQSSRALTALTIFQMR